MSMLRTVLAGCAFLLVAAMLALPRPAAAAAPQGSYRDSCRHIETGRHDGRRWVNAQCKDRSGKWRDARLAYEQCRDELVANDDGKLVCERGGGGGGNLPPGSWKDSCRNAAMRGQTLYADCRRQNGSWRSSSIDPQRCDGRSVANDDGKLVCEGGRGGGGKLPPGSWKDSCRDGAMRGGSLYADCRRQNGSWRSSSIDPQRCEGRSVANDDGRLVCESGRGGGGSSMPGGSWSQSCRNGKMRGSSLYAECRRANGDWKSSSIDTDRCNRRGVANNNGNLVCE